MLGARHKLCEHMQNAIGLVKAPASHTVSATIDQGDTRCSCWELIDTPPHFTNGSREARLSNSSTMARAWESDESNSLVSWFCASLETEPSSDNVVSLVSHAAERM